MGMGDHKAADASKAMTMEERLALWRQRKRLKQRQQQQQQQPRAHGTDQGQQQVKAAPAPRSVRKPTQPLRQQVRPELAKENVTGTGSGKAASKAPLQRRVPLADMQQTQQLPQAQAQAQPQQRRQQQQQQPLLLQPQQPHQLKAKMSRKRQAKSMGSSSSREPKVNRAVQVSPENLDACVGPDNVSDEASRMVNAETATETRSMLDAQTETAVATQDQHAQTSPGPKVRDAATGTEPAASTREAGTETEAMRTQTQEFGVNAVAEAATVSTQTLAKQLGASDAGTQSDCSFTASQDMQINTVLFESEVLKQHLSAAKQRIAALEIELVQAQTLAQNKDKEMDVQLAELNEHVAQRMGFAMKTNAALKADLAAARARADTAEARLASIEASQAFEDGEVEVEDNEVEAEAEAEADQVSRRTTRSRSRASA